MLKVFKSSKKFLVNIWNGARCESRPRAVSAPVRERRPVRQEITGEKRENDWLNWQPDTETKLEWRSRITRTSLLIIFWPRQEYFGEMESQKKIWSELSFRILLEESSFSWYSLSVAYHRGRWGHPLQQHGVRASAGHDELLGEHQQQQLFHRGVPAILGVLGPRCTYQYSDEVVTLFSRCSHSNNWTARASREHYQHIYSLEVSQNWRAS